MNKLQLIKQLIPGLLPLLIYMVAEEIWGTTTGLIVAIVFGVGELAWGMIRKQKPDRFLLIDMGLIVVMGVYFCIEFIFKRHQQKKYATQEWLPLINAQGEVLGKAPRSVVHGGSRLLHPVVHLHVVNHKGVYLQKRPLHKQIQPGKWDTAVGGHVDVGESIDKALARETVEEIGLTGFRARLLGQYVWESSVERELVYSFITADDHGISFNPGELDDARFWSMEEIRANLRRGVFTPNFEREFDEYLGGCFL